VLCGRLATPPALTRCCRALRSTFGLPTEPIFILLGVDALNDMARTTVNVVGNCLASVVVARWEGEFGVEPVSETVVAGMAE